MKSSVCTVRQVSSLLTVASSTSTFQNTLIAHPIVTILEDPWAEPLSNDINLTQTIVHIHMSTATVTILIRRFILETSFLILGLNPPYMKHLQR